MPDLIFFLAILCTVILLGALITAGNERQRAALDGLRLQATRWAEADLHLKQARARREVAVPDPLAWLANLAAGQTGIHPDLIAIHPWESGGCRALNCPCQDGRRLVLTPVPPARFFQVLRRGRGRLARAEVGLLGDHPRRLPVYELSILTCGPFFEEEAALAWKQVTGYPLDAGRLYLFDVPPARR